MSDKRIFCPNLFENCLILCQRLIMCHWCHGIMAGWPPWLSSKQIPHHLKLTHKWNKSMFLPHVFTNMHICWVGPRFHGTMGEGWWNDLPEELLLFRQVLFCPNLFQNCLITRRALVSGVPFCPNLFENCLMSALDALPNNVRIVMINCSFLSNLFENCLIICHNCLLLVIPNYVR